MAHFKAVTPSDTVDLPSGCCAFWINGAGDLAVVAMGDDPAHDVQVLSVPSSSTTGQPLQLPFPITRIMATSTTATGIVALGLG